MEIHVKVLGALNIAFGALGLIGALALMLVFGVSAAVILLFDLVRVLSGNASEDDLVAVKESEEHA